MWQWCSDFTMLMIILWLITYIPYTWNPNFCAIWSATQHRDYYRILVGTTSFGFPWKSIWKQKIPSRVAFFVWTAALRKCLTIDNLRKRRVWILDWCYMYKRNGESVDHLFLHCPLASDLWSMVFMPFWSFLGYAAHSFGAIMVLARQLWSSSKWLYLVHHSSLLIVVSLEGEK